MPEFFVKKNSIYFLTGIQYGGVGINFGRYAPSSSRKSLIYLDGKIPAISHHHAEDKSDDRQIPLKQPFNGDVYGPFIFCQ